MSFLSLSSIEKSVCSCQGGDNGYGNYVVSVNNSKLGVNPITTILRDILPKVFHLQNTFKTILLEKVVGGVWELAILREWSNHWCFVFAIIRPPKKKKYIRRIIYLGCSELHRRTPWSHEFSIWNYPCSSRCFHTMTEHISCYLLTPSWSFNSYSWSL